MIIDVCYSTPLANFVLNIKQSYRLLNNLNKHNSFEHFNGPGSKK